MALKEYKYQGSTYQFDDADVPEGAALVKQAEPKNKQVKPANKEQAKPADKK